MRNNVSVVVLSHSYCLLWLNSYDRRSKNDHHRIRLDKGWYVGKLKEVPGVFSQGESLQKLEKNIREAYQLMRDEEGAQNRPGLQTKEAAN